MRDVVAVVGLMLIVPPAFAALGWGFHHIAEFLLSIGWTWGRAMVVSAGVGLLLLVCAIEWPKGW